MFSLQFLILALALSHLNALPLASEHAAGTLDTRETGDVDASSHYPDRYHRFHHKRDEELTEKHDATIPSLVLVPSLPAIPAIIIGGTPPTAPKQGGRRKRPHTRPKPKPKAKPSKPKPQTNKPKPSAQAASPNPPSSPSAPAAVPSSAAAPDAPQASAGPTLKRAVPPPPGIASSKVLKRQAAPTAAAPSGDDDDKHGDDKEKDDDDDQHGDDKDNDDGDDQHGDDKDNDDGDDQHGDDVEKAAKAAKKANATAAAAKRAHLEIRQPDSSIDVGKVIDSVASSALKTAVSRRTASSSETNIIDNIIGNRGLESLTDTLVGDGSLVDDISQIFNNKRTAEEENLVSDSNLNLPRSARPDDGGGPTAILTGAGLPV